MKVSTVIHTGFYVMFSSKHLLMFSFKPRDKKMQYNIRNWSHFTERSGNRLGLNPGVFFPPVFVGVLWAADNTTNHTAAK